MTLKIKLNKIVFGLVLCIFLTLFSFNKIITKAVDNNYSYDSYDEQLHFLYDNNISIPDGFSDDSNFSIFLNNIFECLRNDINFNFCFNYSETIEFVDEIRNALKKNASDYSLMSEDKRVISNLTNSLVMKDGKWVTSGGDYKDAFQNYNCYSFAIDRLDFNSGFLTANHNISNYKLQIGALSGEKWYSSFGVEKTAKIVVEDLKILGFQNVEYHTSLPNNIDGKDLICLRIGTMDFHFMKYDKIFKCWFHKIGESAIMKYIGSFDNNNSWLSEYSYKGVEYDLPVLYTSDIYYITYDSNNVDINCSAKFDSIESLSLTNNKIKDYVYDLNVNSEMNYRFIFGSQNKFYLYLYDCIGNIISEYDSTMNDNNYVLNIEKYFNVGKYYVQIVPVDENTEFSVNIQFYPEDNDFLYEVIYSSNDILNLFHYDYSSNKKHTTLKYYNNSGAGFYEFSVTGSIVDNVPLEFPEGCIKVYADSSKTILLDEVPFDDYETSESSTSLFVCLPINGYYYIDVELNDFEYESLNFSIEQTECYNEVNYSNNDILNLLHYDYSYNKKHTTLKYYNNSSAGFYEFKVTGSIVDNVPLEFPEGCIKVYADSSKTILLDEIPFDGCEAVSSSNRLFVYLPKNGYYYIDVVLNNYEYKYLRLWIEQDDGYTLDLSNNLMSQPFVPLFENCNQDCYFKKVTLSHRCMLILDALTNDIISTDIPVVIFQQKYDKVLGKYYIETVFLNEMTSTNRGPEFEIILDAGNYYFGFIDNVNNVSITYAIERKINENVDINNTLIADPYESGCDVGSEVMFNNGAIREYTITEGFTRNLYLLFDGVPTQYSSRLDYDWYSSNDSVATVTTYGTVLGLNVEEDTEVTIYAIRKSDPSIIYKRTFTILNDFDEEIIEIECDMSYSYSLKNGVYQLQLNSDNSPYPMIQYYSFEVHEWVQEGEFEVTLDYWGRVTATGPGACVIIGTYILNPRVRVIINLLIEE